MQSTKLLETTYMYLITYQGDNTYGAQDEAHFKALHEVQRLRTLPEIVCLCGSGRFVQEFQDVNLKLSIEGKIVLSIGADNLHTESIIRVDEPAKATLDALHFRKIDLCDRIHVLNINGYIGKNTLAEIKYAVKQSKEVTFDEGTCWLWDQQDLSHRQSVAALMAEIREGAGV